MAGTMPIPLVCFVVLKQLSCSALFWFFVSGVCFCVFSWVRDTVAYVASLFLVSCSFLAQRLYIDARERSPCPQ